MRGKRIGACTSQICSDNPGPCAVTPASVAARSAVRSRPSPRPPQVSLRCEWTGVFVRCDSPGRGSLGSTRPPHPLPRAQLPDGAGGRRPSSSSVRLHTSSEPQYLTAAQVWEWSGTDVARLLIAQPFSQVVVWSPQP